MGFSAILLLGLVLGGYVLLKRFGAVSLLGALTNPSRSRFMRRTEGASGTAAFDITPARVSWAIIVLCVLLFFVGRAFAPIWLFIPVFGYFLLIGARHRKPVCCRVSEGTISAGERSWLLSEVAGLQIRRGSRRGTEEVGTVVTRDPFTGAVVGAKPTSALVGKVLGGRMAERSYLLTLRTRRSSEEEVIAGGLTLECAEALRHDLSECMEQAGLAREQGRPFAE